MPTKIVTRYRLSAEAESEVVSMTCNVCGVEEQRQSSRERLGAGRDVGVHAFYDMHTISLTGSWGDRFPSDDETITFVVHGKCLQAWCATFKAPVESRHLMSSRPTAMSAIHTETDEPVLIEEGWVRGADSALREPAVEDVYALPYTDLAPPLGVYRHFKGNFYQVFDLCWDMDAPHEAYVVYRALYGESQVFVRPVQMWAEQAERDGYIGPRFEKVP